MTDRWQSVDKSEKPEPGKQVLLGVDDEVMSGAWNDKRGLWFSGERPVYPQFWRPMPKPPKRRRM